MYAFLTMITQRKRIVFLLILVGLCGANAFSQKITNEDANALCNRLSEIKQLPHYDEKGVDAIYDSLADAGEKVVPCLIEKVTDKTIMSDPRCPHITDETRVGDVAYFVLVRILKIKFTEMLPLEVQEKYKAEGIYAYHGYIDQKNSRKNLQSKLREWYNQKQKSQS